MMHLDDELASKQRLKVVDLLKHNLETEDDWIVTNVTAEALTSIVIEHDNVDLRKWLLPRLKKMTQDERKSVAGRGRKFIKSLTQFSKGAGVAQLDSCLLYTSPSPRDS